MVLPIFRSGTPKRGKSKQSNLFQVFLVLFVLISFLFTLSIFNKMDRMDKSKVNREGVVNHLASFKSKVENDEHVTDHPTNPDYQVASFSTPALQFDKSVRFDKTSNNIHVLVVGRNMGSALLKSAVTSVVRQEYDPERVDIWLYDDGSDDEDTVATLGDFCGRGRNERFETLTLDGGGKLGIDKINFKKSGVDSGEQFSGLPLHCLRSPPLGPAASKYVAFRRIAASAGPNDVLIVVDGDDELEGVGAFRTVNKAYVNGGFWCTFGSYSGKWNDQTKDIENRAVLEAPGTTLKYRPRSEEPHTSWRYGHPRTFKVHLIEHMTVADFTDAEGDWLLKATDRGFVYRMLELSGVKRVGYIKEEIYKYKFSVKGSTLATVPIEVRQANLQHVLGMEPSDALLLPVHVVFVLWDRLMLLPEQLENLWKQAESLHSSTGRFLHLHLVNNNAATVGQVDAIVQQFCAAKLGTDRCDGEEATMTVVVAHQDYNWHAYARFLYVGELRKHIPIDSVIFIDDDQLWLDEFILSMVQSYAPKSSSHWYGKLYLKSKTKFVDYWATSIEMSTIREGGDPETTRFRYGGPGGSIYATDLWLHEKELFRLSSDLERFHDYDDIWVSYIMDKELGWEMRRYTGPLPYDADRDKKFIAKHTKAEIDHLRAVGTYKSSDGLNNHAKTDFFRELQKWPFNWVVTGEFFD